MPQLEYPEINGRRYTWASAEIAIGRTGQKRDITRLIKSITYSDSLEPAVGRGNSAKKQVRGLGIQEPEASITFYRREWDELLDTLGDGFGAVAFDLSVSYADAGQPTVTDTIVAARIKSYETGGEEGEDLIEVEAELDPMDILIKGKSICPKPT